MTVDVAPLVTLAEIREAARRIRGRVVRTPLLDSPELAAETGAAGVWLKCENLQRAGAFKARGGLNYVSQLPPDERERGIITYSSGNHAQAVALAAQVHGVRSVVVMPTTAPSVKVEGAKRLGAEVHFEGTTSLERKRRAEEIAEAEGLAMVPPFDDPLIIAGQGTVGLEIYEDCPDVDVALVPVGGGGIASGVAAALRRLRPKAQIVGVEPVGGASMRTALEAGGPVTLESTGSIADGLLPVRAGDLTWKHIDALADGVVTVSDAAIREATRFLLHRHRLVVEYSGAATVAALQSGAVDVSERNVVAVLSGGNLDPSFLADLT